MAINSKKLSLISIILLSVLVFAITFLITWSFVKVKKESVLPKGVFVDDIDVSLLSVVSALDSVEQNSAVPDRDIELTWPLGSYVLEIAKFKPEIDFPRLEKELDKALPNGTYFERTAYKRSLKKNPKVIDSMFRFDEEEFNKLTAELDSKVAVEAKDAAFIVNVFDQISISNEKSGLRVDYKKLLTDLPKNYSLGLEVMEVPLIVIKPEHTAATLSSWGIKSLVASYNTEFNVNNHNRAENLKLAVAALDGTILKPGEEFSFNAWVGPRIREMGYKEAPVLVSGEITEDIGGGVCQVSTTLYNMALLSGMEIIERTSHSAPVSYVPPGRDAAVAFDYLDLRFKNSQQNYILITAEVVKNRIYCKVFGSPLISPIQITTENLEQIPFQTKKGTTPKSGRDGTKVDTFVVKGDQKELISQDFYKPIDQIVL